MASHRPIRLTRQRAEALIRAADQACGEWADVIRYEMRSSDPDKVAHARRLDEQRERALAAIAIVQARFLGYSPPPEQAPRLFE